MITTITSYYRSYKLNYISFFSGALGLDQGLESAGFSPLLYCEHDRSCQETIKLNKPHVPLLSDINDYSIKDIKNAAQISFPIKPTLVVGGPPCQAFSTAGARRSFEDDRGNVFIRFLEIATGLEPSFIVIENVRGLLSAKYNPTNKSEHPAHNTKGSALLFVVNYLEKFGYGVSFNLYNSANFGTPQSRERLILIASKDGGKLPYLNPTHSNDPIYGLPKWRTFREAVHGLPPAKKGEYNEIPARRKPFYKYIKEGENWRNLPSELQEEAMGKAFFLGGGKTGFFRRLAWDKPSPTLVTTPTMPATDLIHPEELRALSIKEYARIQEFPDTWLFGGSLTNKYKQIGNAVPLGLGKAIGKTISNYMRGENISPPENFPFSRYKITNDQQLAQSIQNYEALF